MIQPGLPSSEQALGPLLGQVKIPPLQQLKVPTLQVLVHPLDELDVEPEVVLELPLTHITGLIVTSELLALSELN